MFEDADAPDGGEGPPEAATNRPGIALTAHPRHQADRSPSPVTHPPAYRGVVATWPEDWRERWGRRANDLEEAGLSWRDAEAQAFVETWNAVRRRPRTGDVAAPVADPERN